MLNVILTAWLLDEDEMIEVLIKDMQLNVETYFVGQSSTVSELKKII